MNRTQTLIALSGLSALIAIPAAARTLELKTLPTISRSIVQLNCPDKIVVTESFQGQEGGFSNAGRADLTRIATNIEFDNSQQFSVTWKGLLKPQYRNCQGTARISSFNGEDFTGNSYLRARYERGQVFFTLDMTGNRDANNYTTTILFQDIQAGNPSWRWAGSD